jgi:hypothetical protein
LCRVLNFPTALSSLKIIHSLRQLHLNPNQSAKNQRKSKKNSFHPISTRLKNPNRFRVPSESIFLRINRIFTLFLGSYFRTWFMGRKVCARGYFFLPIFLAKRQFRMQCGCTHHHTLIRSMALYEKTSYLLTLSLFLFSGVYPGESIKHKLIFL